MRKLLGQHFIFVHLEALRFANLGGVRFGIYLIVSGIEKTVDDAVVVGRGNLLGLRPVAAAEMEQPVNR